MNVVIINRSDSMGGAAVVSYRLTEALRREGVDAEMLVAEKLTGSDHVHLAAPEWRIKLAFLAERLSIYITRGVTWANLFKIDTASDGLPLHKNPLVKKADIICLNWVNQGMLSLKGLKKLIGLGKPIVWTMHDMWCFTGICHHAGKCRNFERDCGNCPLLGAGGSPHDLSFRILKEKNCTYRELHFVAVSSWLANLARKSTLLKTSPLSVIPNAFPIPESLEIPSIKSNKNGEFKILFGAARVDDPIKGLPILIKATQLLKEKHPAEAKRMRLVTFGKIKNPDSIEGIKIEHTHLGYISDFNKIRDAYRDSDVIVSTSLYETLPGTLVEGQVYGSIPVAFDRGGQADIVDHLSTGYLAQWDDNKEKAAENIAEGILWAMAQDREKIKMRMIESALKRFEASAVAKRYVDLFTHLLHRKPYQKA